MIKDAHEFGVLVRRRRRELGLTQRALAMVSNVGERFLIELEAGKASSQLGKALAVAKALGIDLVDRREIERRQSQENPGPDVDKVSESPS